MNRRLQSAISQCFAGFIYGGLVVVGFNLVVQAVGFAAAILVACVVIVAILFAAFLYRWIMDRRFQIKDRGEFV